MKTINKLLLGLVVSAALVLITTDEAEAQRRGGGGGTFFSGDSSIGFGIALVPASQDDLDKVIDDYNSNNSANTKTFGSGYEFFANWIYRYQRSDYAFIFRPSYFMQSTSGSGNDLKLTGFTVYPMFRLYALENSFISFFLQAGLGYSSLSGDVELGADKFNFEGSAFGAIGGIGADFCFIEGHCLTVEGNLRYSPIVRNTVEGGSCTDTATLQCSKGKEFEFNDKDVGTTLSGIQGLIAYTLKF
ncbi:MAG: hypothetical protein ACLGGX_04450 [Bdellovibrionia bacterium]